LRKVKLIGDVTQILSQIEVGDPVATIRWARHVLRRQMPSKPGRFDMGTQQASISLRNCVAKTVVCEDSLKAARLV
jgi:hypothetical protein